MTDVELANRNTVNKLSLLLSLLSEIVLLFIVLAIYKLQVLSFILTTFAEHRIHVLA